MADKRKRKTVYVVSGGVDSSLTEEQPDKDDAEENQDQRFNQIPLIDRQITHWPKEKRQ
jgi:NH3-dependent NAD+ synthetase